MPHRRLKFNRAPQDANTLAVSTRVRGTDFQPTVDTVTVPRPSRVTRASSSVTGGRRATRRSASTQPGVDNMGANESREANASLHTAATRLQGPNASAGRSSTGKLQRVQKNRNPSKVYSAGTQRALNPTNGIRSSPYDVLGTGSTPLVSRPAEQRTRISPLRATRKNAKAAPDHVAHPGRGVRNGTDLDSARAGAPSDTAVDGLGARQQTIRELRQAIAEAESEELVGVERDHVNIAELQLHAAGQGSSDPQPGSASRLRAGRKRKAIGDSVDGASRATKRIAGDVDLERSNDEEDSDIWKPSDVDAADEEAEGDDDDVTQDRSRPTRTQANTAQGRQADEGASGSQSMLFKQWPHLQRVFHSLANFDVSISRGGERQARLHIPPEDRDAQVTVIVKLCSRAGERFARLRDPISSSTAPLDPVELVTDIRRRVDGLRGRNPDLPTDFRDENKSLNIYGRLIPALVRLLRSAVECYLETDKDSAAEGQIRIVNLRTVTDLITIITNLEATAKTEYVDPGTPQLKAPAHNQVALPLRDVAQVFRRTIQNHELAVQRRKDDEEHATQQAHDRARDLAEAQRQQQIRERREKWKALHSERRAAETAFFRAEKRQHLSYIDHEYDQNGELFYRQEVFLPRVGPPPAIVRDARAEIWSDEELLALVHGLERYTGELVYERIFRRYCLVGQVLNRFNVTQIVTMAAVLKESLLKEQLKDPDLLGMVQPWVRAIPVWIKEEPSDEEALVEGMENGALAHEETQV